MQLSTRDRVWLMAGGVLAVLVVALGWLLVVGPQHNSTNSLKSQTVDAQAQVTTLQHNVSQLRLDNANLPKYQAALASAQQALPSDPGLPEFLRQMQSIGAATGVSVIAITVSPPTAVLNTSGAAAATATSTAAAVPTAAAGSGHVAGLNGPVYSISISMTAVGTTDAITLFLKQLQQVQPRAVLVLATTEAPAANASGVTLTLGLEAFVAPGATTSPPAATPTASK